MLSKGTKVTVVDTMGESDQILWIGEVNSARKNHTVKRTYDTLYFESTGHKRNEREYFWGIGRFAGMKMRTFEVGDDTTWEAQKVARNEAAAKFSAEKKAQRAAQQAAHWEAVSEWKSKNSTAWSERQEVETQLGTIAVFNITDNWDRPEVWMVSFAEVDEIDWDATTEGTRVRKVWSANVGKMGNDRSIGSSSRVGKGATREEAFWSLFG